MKPILFVLALLCVAACSVKEPSGTVVQTAQREVAAVQHSLQHLEEATPFECRGEELLAGLDAIAAQVSVFSDQLDIITAACQKEKDVLEECIASRGRIILVLVMIILFLGYLIVRKS